MEFLTKEYSFLSAPGLCEIFAQSAAPIDYGSIKVEIENKSGTNAWLVVSLSEGKNREIRKVMKAIGLDVARLIRLSYGPFQLGSLKKGEVREVPTKVLKEQLGGKFEL